MTIRSATDVAYASHLRALQRNEAGRLGRRLRALREDRGITKNDLSDAAEIPLSQLSRIEAGEEAPNTSTVRLLLRVLRAPFAEIAGPDAPEMSLQTLIRNAVRAGVPRDLGTSLAAAVPRRAVPSFLARAFAWSRDDLIFGVPETPELPIAVQFKAAPGQQRVNSPLVHLAFSVAQLARSAFSVAPYRLISSEPAAIREEAVDPTGKITLGSLLSWTWSKGIPVLPLVGKGGFAAAVFAIDRAPTIVIKEARDLEVFWLFDLAHELGHISRGHVRDALVDVQSPTQPRVSDVDEHSATEFALELLLPNYAALLDAVRADARGDGVRFKFSVERVATRASVSPGLLVDCSHEFESARMRRLGSA